MHYYILEKEQQLTAIAAEHAVYQHYLASGYAFVAKMSAWSEKTALQSFKKQSQHATRSSHVLMGAFILALGLCYLL